MTLFRARWLEGLWVMRGIGLLMRHLPMFLLRGVVWGWKRPRYPLTAEVCRRLYFPSDPVVPSNDVDRMVRAIRKRQRRNQTRWMRCSRVGW